MPRNPRQISQSGYYHVILKGTGSMIIFEDDVDRRRFLYLLEREIREKGIEVLAWCLMSNHVHILVCDPSRTLSEVIHRITSCYARHFNERHQHEGHVFSGRFFSRTIETDNYLIAAARYIMRNPLEAGLGLDAVYSLTSFGEYMGLSARCNTQLLLEMIGGKEALRDFVLGEEGSYDPYEAKSNTLSELIDLGKTLLDASDWQNLSSGNKDLRDASIAKLRKGGVSIRQAQRITGLGKNIVERAYRKYDT